MGIEAHVQRSEVESVAEVIDGLSTADDAVAVLVFGETDVTRITREELGQSVCALARGLLGHGIQSGDRVVVCGSASPAWMTAALGVIRAGAVVVPVDSQMDDAGLAHVIGDSRPSCVFTDNDHRVRLSALEVQSAPDVFLLGDCSDRAHWSHLASDNPSTDLPDMDSGDDVVLFYTSGTTGEPKGVPLTCANLVFQINTIRHANIVTDADRVLLALPLHHVYPFVMGMLAPLAVGAPLILPRALTGPQLLRAIREGETTVMAGVPRLYRALYDGIHARMASRGRVAAWAMARAEDLSTWLRRGLNVSVGRWLLRPLHKYFGGTLRLMASGGSSLDPELGYRLEGMGWVVGVGYGLTETAPLLTLRLPGREPLESVGRPVPHVDLRIDEDCLAERGGRGQELRTRSKGPGEIQVRGPGVFRGYRNREEDTKQAFTEDGWFRTGDIGYMDEDGYVYVTGRVSSMIVTEGGENVQPEDVERLYESHPMIKEIGVLEKGRRLVGLVVVEEHEPEGTEGEDAAALVRRAVNERSGDMPSYMRLSGLRITRAALPRTRLGKIRRHLLERRYDEAGSEEGARNGRPMPYEGMSDHDRALLENDTTRRVWEWLCERFPDRGLSPDSSPQMDLDVDSMEWLNLALGIREHAGVELTAEAIARVSTVRDILEEAANAASGDGGEADPVDAPYQVLSEAEQRWLKPLGPGLHILSQAAYWLGSGLLRIVFRIRTEGRERIPEDGACVLTPNHGSYIDPFVLGHVLGSHSIARTYWAGLTTAAFDTAPKRFGCRLGRVVPIYPRHGATGALAYASAILNRGQRLVWFPEGQRTRDGQLQEFKPGLGRVLEKIPVPVVPVWIGGAYKVWPSYRRLPRPGRLQVVFGDPVSVEALKSEGQGEDTAEQIVNGLRRRVAQLGRS